MANPTAAQFGNGDCRTALAEAVTKALNSQHSMSDQALQDPKVFNEVAEACLAEVYAKAREAQAAACGKASVSSA
jgi:type I restriction enzyme, R subunit